MKIIKIINLLTILILTFEISHGQTVSGIIKSKTDSIPIPFVNILVEGTQVGTASNDDGEFELSTSELKQDFVIIVSAIGYISKKIKVVKKSYKSTLTILLEESSIELQEVEITYLSPKTILNHFYKNYSTNYPQETSRLKAYYHSTLTENDNCKHLLEATVDIQEYNKKKQRAFQVQITQYRKSNDYRTERWAEKNNYLYDAIASNPLLGKSDFLDLKNLKYYYIERLPNTSYDGEICYVLKFTPKKSASKPLYEAIAHFNSNDFALIRANYYFKNADLKIPNQSLKNKTYHIPFISGKIQYQKIGRYYTQKYLSYNNGWTIINNVSNDTIVKDVLRDEILFTDIRYSDSTQLSHPLTKWGDVYKKPFIYDAEYWSNQTRIPTSRLFEKAILDLEKHLSIEIQYYNNSAQGLPQQKFANTASGRIDSILSVYHLTKLFNGVALVTNKGKTIHHKAYGFLNFYDSIPLDTGSIFDIGSITKQFTTTMIFKLREQGKLELHDKIGKFLPNYRFANQISIDQLLCHRSGIPTFDHNEKLNGVEWFDRKMERKEMIKSYCSDDLEFPPDSKMEYSNSNFIILAAIIEEIEGKDFYSVLNDLILQPLGLKHTYSYASIPAEQIAIGYTSEENHLIPEVNWEKNNVLGAGGIYSNSSDLLKWIMASNSSKLISIKDNALIKSPISYYEYYDSEFGYSWAINGGTLSSISQTYFYGGSSLGFFSMITTIPEKGINVILLNNTGNFPRIELTNEILKTIE